jgi:hypothetical protein
MPDLLKSLKISLDSQKSLLLMSGIGVLGVGIPLLVGGYMFGGAVHTPFQTLFQKPEYLINGSVEPGYEEVMMLNLTRGLHRYSFRFRVHLKPFFEMVWRNMLR